MAGEERRQVLGYRTLILHLQEMPKSGNRRAFAARQPLAQERVALDKPRDGPLADYTQHRHVDPLRVVFTEVPFAEGGELRLKERAAVVHRLIEGTRQKPVERLSITGAPHRSHEVVS